MIVFYELDSGKIIGYIEGRRHTDIQRRMTLKTQVPVASVEYEYNEQEEVCRILDVSPNAIYQYKVDLQTHVLIKLDNEQNNMIQL